MPPRPHSSCLVPTTLPFSPGHLRGVWTLSQAPGAHGCCRGATLLTDGEGVAPWAPSRLPWGQRPECPSPPGPAAKSGCRRGRASVPGGVGTCVHVCTALKSRVGPTGGGSSVPVKRQETIQLVRGWGAGVHALEHRRPSIQAHTWAHEGSVRSGASAGAESPWVKDRSQRRDMRAQGQPPSRGGRGRGFSPHGRVLCPSTRGASAPRLPATRGAAVCAPAGEAALL